MARTHRIGVISDTHGLLRPEAAAFLAGCEHIVHAGDICDARTLEAIARIAPVTAVRGNNDRGPWAQALSLREDLDIDGVRIHIVHDVADLAIDPVAAGVRVVVTGHSHRPRCEERDGVWHFNPGSAGPRRFSLPISIGELVIGGGRVTPRLVELVTSR